MNATAGKVYRYIQDKGFVIDLKGTDFDPGFLVQAGRFGKSMDSGILVLAVPVPYLNEARGAVTLGVESAVQMKPEGGMSAGAGSPSLLFPLPAAGDDARVLDQIGKGIPFEWLSASREAGRPAGFADLRLEFSRSKASP
jgi:hypothetical protein